MEDLRVNEMTDKEKMEYISLHFNALQDFEKEYFNFRVYMLEKDGMSINKKIQAMDDVIKARAFAQEGELEPKNGKIPTWDKIYVARFRVANDFDKGMEILGNAKLYEGNKSAFSTKMSEETKQVQQVRNVIASMKLTEYVKSHEDDVVLASEQDNVYRMVMVDTDIVINDEKIASFGDYVKVTSNEVVAKKDFKEEYEILEPIEDKMKPFLTLNEQMTELAASTTYGASYHALSSETKEIANEILHHGVFGSKEHSHNHWQLKSEDLFAVEMQLYALGIGAEPTIESLQNKTVEDFQKDVLFAKNHMNEDILQSFRYDSSQKLLQDDVDSLLNMGQMEWKSVVDTLKEGLEKQKIDEMLMAEELKDRESPIVFQRVRTPNFKREMEMDGNPNMVIAMMQENGWEIEHPKADDKKKEGVQQYGVLRKGVNQIKVETVLVNGEKKSVFTYEGDIHTMNQVRGLLKNDVSYGNAHAIERLTKEEMIKHLERNRKIIEEEIINKVNRDINKKMYTPMDLSLSMMSSMTPQLNTADRNFRVPMVVGYASEVVKQLVEDGKHIRLTSEGKIRPTAMQVVMESDNTERSRNRE